MCRLWKVGGELTSFWQRLLRRVADKPPALPDTAGQCLPAHVAIIMDGNGRWATRRGLPRLAGHRAGVEALRGIVRFSAESGIRYLTLYAFSTENWERPQEEVTGLMNLLIEYLRAEVAQLHENGIRLNFIGRTDRLSELIQAEIKRAGELTQSNNKLTVNLALNYGGRAEIVDAVKVIAGKLRSGEIADGDAINESVIADNLYTAGMPDPDLIIRPSGEKRLSNFLLWQSAYAEFWVSDVLWPDFRPAHLVQALEDYQRRERRFGRIRQ
ncbi:MAG: isoprenyl transferase [bacterium]|jgi:undecaprenyl diphosphate synthase